MLSVQNSETWALSQANPKTEQIFPSNRASFSPKRSQFVPKTEPVFPKHGDGFFPQTEPVFPKSQANFSQKPSQFFPKTEPGFPQKRSQFVPKTEPVFPKHGDGFFSQTEPVFSKHGASFSLLARQLDMVLFCMWTCYTRICIWAPATWDRLSQVKTGLHVTHDMHWHAIFQVWCLLLPSLYLLLFGPLLDHLSHLPVLGMPSALLSRILFRLSSQHMLALTLADLLWALSLTLFWVPLTRLTAAISSGPGVAPSASAVRAPASLFNGSSSWPQLRLLWKWLCPRKPGKHWGWGVHACPSLRRRCKSIKDDKGWPN